MKGLVGSAPGWWVTAGLACLLGCAEPPKEDAVIAEIGDEALRQSQFEAYVRNVVPLDAAFAEGELKAALLEELIEERLLTKAARAEGIALAEEENEESRSAEPVAPLMEDETVGDDPAPSEPGSPRDHRAIRKLMDEKILKDVAVEDGEIEDFYERNRAYYRVSEIIEVSQILVESRQEAEQILAELQKNPKQFQELARRHSVAPEASQGGNLGKFRRGELPTSFERAVFALRKGRFSDIVETDFGYHIFRLDDVVPGRELGLAEVRDSIRVELLRQKSDAAMIRYVAELKRRYPVKVYAERLDFPYFGGAAELGGDTFGGEPSRAKQ